MYFSRHRVCYMCMLFLAAIHVHVYFQCWCRLTKAEEIKREWKDKLPSGVKPRSNDQQTSTLDTEPWSPDKSMSPHSLLISLTCVSQQENKYLCYQSTKIHISKSNKYVYVYILTNWAVMGLCWSIMHVWTLGVWGELVYHKICLTHHP